MSKQVSGIWITRDVRIGEDLLDPAESQRLYNHSLDGFSWGYAGSGPAQLALALLLRYTTQEEALKFYQEFKWDILSALPEDNFQFPDDVIKDWLLAKRRGQAARA